MKHRIAIIRGIAATFAMLVIILDTKTAIVSAQDGLQLCIRTVIPSLFPFFVLSGLVNSCLLGHNAVILRPLGRFCKIPKGSESLLILGFLAGYPVGAQLITHSYRDGRLSAQTARRMLGFCNNAGPAFIFGILSPLFENTETVWILWGVHIVSALITAKILPANTSNDAEISCGNFISFSDSLQRALRAMASVCGWVIIFRVIIGFCSRWFLWLFSYELQVLFSGVLELTNGCVLLQNVPQQGLRFLLAGAMLSFGGICVGMQTISVTGDLGPGLYFPGKALQATISVMLCVLLQPVIFGGTAYILPPATLITSCAFTLLILTFILRRKKVVAFPEKLLYNTNNQ